MKKILALLSLLPNHYCFAIVSQQLEQAVRTTNIEMVRQELEHARFTDLEKQSLINLARIRANDLAQSLRDLNPKEYLIINHFTDSVTHIKQVSNPMLRDDIDYQAPHSGKSIVGLGLAGFISFISAMVIAHKSMSQRFTEFNDDTKQMDKEFRDHNKFTESLFKKFDKKEISFEELQNQAFKKYDDERDAANNKPLVSKPFLNTSDYLVICCIIAGMGLFCAAILKIGDNVGAYKQQLKAKYDDALAIEQLIYRS